MALFLDFVEDDLVNNAPKVEVAGSLRLGGGPLHAITWTEMIAFLRCLAGHVYEPNIA